MFPGQGAQKPEWAKDFYEQSETARKVIDKADGTAGYRYEKHYALKKMISWTRQSIHRQRL